MKSCRFTPLALAWLASLILMLICDRIRSQDTRLLVSCALLATNRVARKFLLIRFRFGRVYSSARRTRWIYYSIELTKFWYLTTLGGTDYQYLGRLSFRSSVNRAQSSSPIWKPDALTNLFLLGQDETKEWERLTLILWSLCNEQAWDPKPNKVFVICMRIA